MAFVGRVRAEPEARPSATLLEHVSLSFGPPRALVREAFLEAARTLLDLWGDGREEILGCTVHLLTSLPIPITWVLDPDFIKSRLGRRLDHSGAASFARGLEKRIGRILGGGETALARGRKSLFRGELLNCAGLKTEALAAFAKAEAWLRRSLLEERLSEGERGLALEWRIRAMDQLEPGRAITQCRFP